MGSLKAAKWQTQLDKHKAVFNQAGGGKDLSAGKTTVQSPARRCALNSVVECYLHTVEVVGSNPTVRTIFLSFFSFLKNPC